MESEIARPLGISRGPVREALFELDREGLIVTYPRKGTYVNNFTEKDIEEIYTFRSLLESYAGTRASHKVKQEDLKRLGNILDEICKIDTADSEEIHMQFHEEILKLADHKRLHAGWKSLVAQIRMLSGVAAEPEHRRDLTEIRKDHEMLVDALIRGDEAYIKECFERHILDAMNRLIGHLRKMQEEEQQKEKSLQPLMTMKSVQHR